MELGAGTRRTTAIPTSVQWCEGLGAGGSRLGVVGARSWAACAREDAPGRLGAAREPQESGVGGARRRRPPPRPTRPDACRETLHTKSPGGGAPVGVPERGRRGITRRPRVPDPSQRAGPLPPGPAPPPGVLFRTLFCDGFMETRIGTK